MATWCALDRSAAIASAAAHDLNNELTIILIAAVEMLELLEPSHPAWPLLLDLRSATLRCAWKTAGLLQYAGRHGAEPSSSSMEALAEEGS